MAGFKYTISIDDVAARKLLAGMIDRGEDLTPAMDEIGAAVTTSTIERFDRGVSPEGVPWLPSIRAREQGGKTLIDSGRLRDSITWAAFRDAVEIGTNVIYAAIHQLGGVISAKSGGLLKFRLPGGRFVSVGSVTIPKRTFIGISQDDREEISDILTDHIMAGATP